MPSCARTSTSGVSSSRARTSRCNRHGARPYPHCCDRCSRRSRAVGVRPYFGRASDGASCADRAQRRTDQPGAGARLRIWLARHDRRGALCAAVAFVGERLKLIEAAQALTAGQRDFFAAERRAIERDRFGIAAHVLAQTYGCTVEKCAVFALLNDTRTLKADLAAQPFATLVARYEGVWDKPVDERVPVATLRGAPAEVKAQAAPSAAEALAKA